MSFTSVTSGLLDLDCNITNDLPIHQLNLIRNRLNNQQSNFTFSDDTTNINNYEYPMLFQNSINIPNHDNNIDDDLISINTNIFIDHDTTTSQYNNYNNQINQINQMNRINQNNNNNNINMTHDQNYIQQENHKYKNEIKNDPITNQYSQNI